MIALSPQTRVLVALASVDFRCGIDRLAHFCRTVLGADPMSGTVFVFRNRKGTSVKALVYDGQGYWLCQKRLSRGKFVHWPVSGEQGKRSLLWYELLVLLSCGNPNGVKAPPPWRPILPTFQYGKENRDHFDQLA